MHTPAPRPWWIQIAYPEDPTLITILALILVSALVAVALAKHDDRRGDPPPHP